MSNEVRGRINKNQKPHEVKSDKDKANSNDDKEHESKTKVELNEIKTVTQTEGKSDSVTPKEGEKIGNNDGERVQTLQNNNKMSTKEIMALRRAFKERENALTQVPPIKPGGSTNTKGPLM